MKIIFALGGVVLLAVSAGLTWRNLSYIPLEMLTATDLSADTVMVQLGAYDTAEEAENSWHNILDRTSDLTGHRKAFLMHATSGNRDFYRLRMMGFEDRSAVLSLCDMLRRSWNVNCIPVPKRP